MSGIGLRTTLGLSAGVQRVPAALARGPDGGGQGDAAERPVEVGLHLAHGSLREVTLTKTKPKPQPQT